MYTGPLAMLEIEGDRKTPPSYKLDVLQHCVIAHLVRQSALFLMGWGDQIEGAVSGEVLPYVRA